MGMAAAAAHKLMILGKTPKFSFKNPQSRFVKTYIFYSPKSPTYFNSLHSLRVNSLQSRSPSIRTHHPIQELLLLLALSLTLLCFRFLSNALLSDFPLRWQHLIDFSCEAEARTKSYPKHLWRAIVAYEDRRFFRHFGIDPFGICRAVLSLSARGGGSTITQQLVKNTLLKNERTFSRKILETVLALVLERTMSKQRILSSYVCKIYWGHGINDIESASKFYFGKHPSLLSLAESAMLTGLIPAPELRSPLRDHTSGKTFQARVLKRMVQVGFLDIEMALLAVRQPLYLHLSREEHASGPSDELGVGEKNKQNEEGTESTWKGTWDWERESKIREVCEEMERWAIKVRLGNA
ncbi:putative Ribonuclease II/R family protein [Hibiscus syriacus]|uniref:Ribonuclease II/R family protein n=1 Tax=Hibiscus syriacus TaxID=106335 RepID=A0A6A2YCX1_HIBSY|nr:biosynthetic peptidoglycan transglycosylase-like [Hibiscus syriacus]KAE8671107.1 putative Ribonuclease II/R family protein [Hibiscus syriacus]